MNNFLKFKDILKRIFYSFGRESQILIDDLIEKFLLTSAVIFFFISIISFFISVFLYKPEASSLLLLFMNVSLFTLLVLILKKRK